jgi:ABC-2 type transport system ATP-binding protein
VIRSNPATRNVTVDEGSVTIELDTDDAGVAHLLRLMLSQGVEIRSYADKDPTLEDVFMLVTKGLVT